MNWEAIGAVGEILGALAVVISVVYLAFQLRLNTNATKATNRNSITEHNIDSGRM